MYPNEPCNDCPEEEGSGIPLPEKCGDQCAEIVDAACVSYTGAAVYCDTTPIAVPGSSLSSTLESMATQICFGVGGIAATLSIGTVVVNAIDYDQPASGSIVNSGTTGNAVLDITLNIPEGIPADAVNIKATSTDSESISTGVKVLTFPAALIGPYVWDDNSRVRISFDGNNYMEGLVTAHTANDVTVNIDYTVGSGTYAQWDIALSGDPGDQGVAGTVTVNSPATVNQVATTAPAAVSIVNSGTAQNAILDFTFDIPAGNGVASAVIDGNGDLIITLDDATIINAGFTLGQGLAAGGTAGQVLTKIDATDYNTTWADPDGTGWMPTGGTADQFLIKQTGTDYDALWVDNPLCIPKKPLLTAGTYIPEVFVASEFEFINAINQFNAIDGASNGYKGAKIYLSEDITLSADHSLKFDGITVIGNRVHKIIHEPAGTSYVITCTSGSPTFQGVVFAGTTLATATTGVHNRFYEINDVGTTPSITQFIDCIFENIVQGPSAAGSNILLTDGDPGSELIIKGCSIITGLAADALTPNVDIKMVIESTAWNAAITIEDMKFLRATSKGEALAPATVPTPYDDYVSSIYFVFIGTYGTQSHNILTIDMESYAYSALNSHFGANDSVNVYIKNSMFMYGDDDNAQVSLKPNGFGVFGWNNPSAPYPLDDTTYA
jgi:hypothetical protein